MVRLVSEHGGVETAHLADEPGGRAGVQAVQVGHREATDDLLAPRLGLFVGGHVVGTGQVRGLAHQRGSGLGGDLGAARTARGSDRGDDQALDDRRGGEQDPVAGRRVVEQVEGQLGAEDGTAEVHQDDDPGRAVDLLDRLLDPDGVGAEGVLVEAGSHLDVHRAAVQHLAGQADSGPRQGSAVGDDHDADARSRCHGG